MKKAKLMLVSLIMLVVFMLPCIALAADGDTGAPNFWAYIVDEAYVLIPVLYVIGMMIKKIPKIPDWIIPFGLLVIAIPVAMALSGWTIQGAIQGVLVAGVTVFANQLYKQSPIKKE